MVRTASTQIDALQTVVLNLHAAWPSDSLSGTCHRLLPVDVANPPNRMGRLQCNTLHMVSSGNAAEHILRNWTNVRRHDQETYGQGLRVYRHWERQRYFFHSSNLEGVSYEDLQEGQRVSYTEGSGPKGPRAENVKPV